MSSPESSEGEHLAVVSYFPGAGSRAGRDSAADPGGRSRPSAIVAASAPPEGSPERDGRAEEVAVRRLARRGLSRHEVEQALQQAEIPPAAAAAELADLERRGLVDDAALARDLVERFVRRKGLARTAIERELRQRHLDAEAIAEALASVDESDERACVTRLALERARRLAGLDPQVGRRRLAAYLARKGYSHELVRAAVEEALPGGA